MPATQQYWARRVRNEMLYDRETGYRNDMIAELQVTLHFLKPYQIFEHLPKIRSLYSLFITVFNR